MRLEVMIDGMLAIHSRHAVFAALGGVDAVRGAEVELGRAVIEVESGVDLESVKRALSEAIAAVGCRVASVRVLPRSLPLL